MLLRVVGEVEALWELEVELNGSALVRSTQGIVNGDVNLSS